MDVEMRVMKQIDDARKASGMSQEQLAELIGVSQGQVSRMLAAKSPASLAETIKLCDAVGLDLAAVVARAESSAG
ncbi:helix-turn-helix transcriptional regulator [Phycicoccus sp. HDW14]|uniref:helix-turn-helix domain-containing protein n=1 Tax=Phycicoccus sp. HDW14 TaxID=2714941 RepID=UPI00140A4518|nr:helix-turn-helix transcriptional regulator [Phycicoccus sp. HDW14]QIM19912.1 helix-turn-helix transcriptional regulator [Phycicoccus sp. HDW14]